MGAVFQPCYCLYLSSMIRTSHQDGQLVLVAIVSVLRGVYCILFSEENTSLSFLGLGGDFYLFDSASGLDQFVYHHRRN